MTRVIPASVTPLSLLLKYFLILIIWYADWNSSLASPYPLCPNGTATRKYLSNLRKLSEKEYNSVMEDTGECDV